MRRPQLERYFNAGQYVLITYPTGRRWDFRLFYTYPRPSSIFDRKLHGVFSIHPNPSHNRWTDPVYNLTCLNCGRELWAYDPKLLRFMAVWGYVGVIREC